MSGLRISPAYDTEISLSWLDPLPDYRPALGAGRLEVIVGPMFAGKSTALLNRVSECQWLAECVGWSGWVMRSGGVLGQGLRRHECMGLQCR